MGCGGTKEGRWAKALPITNSAATGDSGGVLDDLIVCMQSHGSAAQDETEPYESKLGSENERFWIVQKQFNDHYSVNHIPREDGEISLKNTDQHVLLDPESEDDHNYYYKRTLKPNWCIQVFTIAEKMLNDVVGKKDMPRHLRIINISF